MPEKINTRKIKPSILTGRIDTSSFNKETNEVNVVFATENLVREEFKDGERFYEQLAMQNDAADLARFNNGAAVLDNHSDESVRNQFGKVVKAWIDEGTKEAWATVRLSKQKEWETVVGDIADGIIANISFKFSRRKMVDTGQEKDGLRILRTTLWEGLELSFVTIPADYRAGVRSTNEEETEVTIITNTKNSNTMTEQEKQARKVAIQEACRKLKLSDEFANELIDDETITIEAARGKAIDKAAEVVPTPAPAKTVDLEGEKKERKRALEITQVCRKLNLDKEAGSKEDVLFVDELIEKGISVDAARALAIDKAAEVQAAKIDISGANSAGVKNADREAKRALAKQHAIMQRAGIVLKDDDGKVIKFAPDVYRGMSLMELACSDIVEAGGNPRMMSENELKMAIFGKRSAGQLTTSDFPSITENVLNKIALNNYNLAAKTWEPFTTKREVKDFKPVSNVQFNDVLVDETREIKEGGEYQLVSMSDSAEKFSVKKYGVKAVLAWEALMNDDLSIFDTTAGNIAQSFGQLQSNIVYKILTSTTALKSGANVMFDGNVLFHSSHSNLVGSGAAVSIDTLNAARILLLKQKAPNGNLLNLLAKYIVAGPNMVQLLDQYTSANYTPVDPAKINKYGQTLTPIIDARISDNAWFLIVDPALRPTIQVASLPGQELYTESRWSFDVDGMEIKFRMTFGAKAIDWRGFVKSPTYS